VNTAAPEVLDFLGGDNAPPFAPRGGQDVSISAPSGAATGESLTCDAGTWSGAPAITYQFIDRTTKSILQSGAASVHQLEPQEAGDVIYCRVLATNAGGTGVGASQQAFAIAAGTQADSSFTLQISGLKAVAKKQFVATLKIKNRAGYDATSVRACLSAKSGAKFVPAAGSTIPKNRASQCWLIAALKAGGSKSLQFEVLATGKTSGTRLDATLDAIVNGGNVNPANGEWHLTKKNNAKRKKGGK
jgi:hypothetical protein